MLNKKAISEELNNNIYVYQSSTNEESISPNSIEENYILVTLGDTLKVYDTPVLSMKEQNPTKIIKIPKEGYLIEPGKTYLGCTNEYTKTFGNVPILTKLPGHDIQGLDIHIDAGFGDNGFEGTWTLEIRSLMPILLYPNMPIGKIGYHPLLGDQTITYNGKYKGQINPEASRISNEKKQNPIKEESTQGTILTSDEIAKQIKSGSISISPLMENALAKPNSCSISIGDILFEYPYHIIDSREREIYLKELLEGEGNRLIPKRIPKEGLLLEPFKIYLARTNERIKTSGFIPYLNGKTSLSLLGLSINLNDGYLYDNYDGYLPLLIVATKPTIIVPNIEIGNLAFFKSLDNKNQNAGMLSGEEIKRRMEIGDIIIDPINKTKINPNSINLTLNKSMAYYPEQVLDLRKENKIEVININEDGTWLYPNEFYIGKTNEWTETNNLIPMISGRSSIGRLGMYVRCSGAMGSIGYQGNWHLGIRTSLPIKIFKDSQICQLYYFTPDGIITNTYSGTMQDANHDQNIAKQFYKKVKTR